jgi:hypothetical protein
MEECVPSLRRVTGPEIPTAERLEHVRRNVHCVTLRDFWRELTVEGGYQISYEAVRNYHHDREPPVDYLVQVAKVFDADLHWLATGQGSAWAPSENGNGVSTEAEAEPEDDAGRAYEAGMRDHLRRYDQLPPLAVTVLLRTCDRFYRDAQLRARLKGKAGPTRPYVGRFVGKAVAGPLVNAVAGTVRTSDLHPWQIENYVLGVCGALSSLIPNPNWTSPQVSEEMH